MQAVSAILFFGAASLLLLAPSVSEASNFTDVDILNFALNLEVRFVVIVIVNVDAELLIHSSVRSAWKLITTAGLLMVTGWPESTQV